MENTAAKSSSPHLHRKSKTKTHRKRDKRDLLHRYTHSTKDYFDRRKGNRSEDVVEDNKEDELKMYWLRGASNSFTYQPSASPTISPAPSPPPTNTCGMTDELRRDMILLMLENLNPDPDLIYTAGTPQHQAAEWLIDQDLFTACPSDPKLVQRYVLAVFYYSTNGDSWDQCSQNDATCGDNAPFFLDRNFLSDSSECEWAGASCDFDGCIIRLEFELNNIAGTIPSELEHLEDLEILILEQGNLTGTIPSALGNLAKLETLDLDFNQMTGTIPVELLTSASQLEVLDLNSNGFTGTLPTEMGLLPNLHFLQLHANSFTGTIPTEMSNVSTLGFAEFFNNTLTGTMPSGVCDLFVTGVLNLLAADCFPNPDTGVVELECTCCTSCSNFKQREYHEYESLVNLVKKRDSEH